MRSLFFKIFFWFWLAVIMAGAASVIVMVFFPSQTLVVQLKNYFTFNLATTGKLGADIYEKSGRQELDAFLRQIETISSFRLYLISDQGVSLSGQLLPAGAAALARSAMSTSTVRLKDIVAHPLVAIKTIGESGRSYVIMLELPQGVSYFFSLTQGHMLRLLGALVASGLVCLLLSRYLTAPIKKLQSAVRQFAQGELGVRVGRAIGIRNDEIANLAEDFDAMAARIESLMDAHEQLLRDVAHELRSPLTRLNVALEITRKHAGPEAGRFLDRIDQETSKLSRLITQILTWSRLENTDLTAQKSPVALEEIIERIAQDASFEGQSRNCSVNFICQDKCTLQIDSNLIRSGIENVVRNALRFSPSGAQVDIIQTVVCEDTTDYASIEVRDSGPGVTADALESLFKPFFRANHTNNITDRTSGGAGLGLAIASRAVNLHKGRIYARNLSDGGLMVAMRLPIISST